MKHSFRCADCGFAVCWHARLRGRKLNYSQRLGGEPPGRYDGPSASRPRPCGMIRSAEALGCPVSVNAAICAAVLST